jgi:ribosome recycling factor
VFLWEIIQTPAYKKIALRHLKRIMNKALDDFDHWKEDESEKIS